MKKVILSFLFLTILIFPNEIFADGGPYIGIPPTNAFDKIHSDNGTISAVNFSMPLTIRGGSGITVQSSNASHTLTITNTATPNTHNGSYNTTQANNVNINSGGYKINFINGTGATVHLQNSGAGNQVNVTVSATGTSSGVTSLNALTGALTIACVSGNTTCTTSGGNTITVNTAYNVVVTGGSAQTITKGITHTADLTMSGANINLGSNYLKTTNLNITQKTDHTGLPGILIQPNTNSYGYLTIAPGGGSKSGFMSFYTTTDLNTNYASMLLGGFLTANNEYALQVRKGGSGSLFPFNIWMDGKKEASFDTANTTTIYVPLKLQDKITQYNSINTAGWGVPAIYGSGRLTGQTNVITNIVSYTVGGSDGTFEISGDVLATNSTSYTFMEMVDWTDEAGTSRSTGLMFTGPGISGVTATLSNTNGPSFEGLPLTIHAKAGTTIKLHTNAGTFTTVTYNIEGFIKQIS